METKKQVDARIMPQEVFFQLLKKDRGVTEN